MKALVTGATGFVGNPVARVLAAEGFQVRVLARKESRYLNTLDSTWEVAWGDVRDAASVRDAMRGCDAVFHVAALYAFWPMWQQPYYEANVLGTRNVLQAALDSGVRRVVHTSSWVTVGRRKDGGLTTEVDTPPTKRELVGPYRKTKFLAEEEARSFAAKGLDVVIASPTVPVGPGDARPTPTGRIVLDFLRRRIPAYVEADLNLVAVEDVAQGHLLAWQQGKRGENYLLGGQNLKLSEILTILSGLTGLPPVLRRVSYPVTLASAYLDTFVEGVLMQRTPRVPLEGVLHAGRRVRVSSDKAQRELGFVPSSVEDALARAIQWYRTHKYA